MNKRIGSFIFSAEPGIPHAINDEDSNGENKTFGFSFFNCNDEAIEVEVIIRKIAK